MIENLIIFYLSLYLIYELSYFLSNWSTHYKRSRVRPIPYNKVAASLKSRDIDCSSKRWSGGGEPWPDLLQRLFPMTDPSGLSCLFWLHITCLARTWIHCNLGYFFLLFTQKTLHRTLFIAPHTTNASCLFHIQISLYVRLASCFPICWRSDYLYARYGQLVSVRNEEQSYET
jgi:hypothetical protein